MKEKRNLCKGGVGYKQLVINLFTKSKTSQQLLSILCILSRFEKLKTIHNAFHLLLILY